MVPFACFMPPPDWWLHERSNNNRPHSLRPLPPHPSSTSLQMTTGPTPCNLCNKRFVVSSLCVPPLRDPLPPFHLLPTPTLLMTSLLPRRRPFRFRLLRMPSNCWIIWMHGLTPFTHHHHHPLPRLNVDLCRVMTLFRRISLNRTY